MDPVILAFGIQATLRAAQAGANLYGEQARDRKIFLPDLELPTGSRPVQLAQFLTENSQLASQCPDFVRHMGCVKIRSSKPPGRK